MDDKELVIGWVRHYARLVCAVTLLGAALAGVYLTVAPRDFQAWTIISQTNDRIPVNHLDSVAAAIFESQAVYQPAIKALGVSGSPTEFLRDHTSLRSIPDSNTVIVVGRDPSLSRAKAISAAFGDSLVRAFATRSGANFAVFGKSQPSPIPEHLGTKMGILLGAFTAFWLALAASLIHFHAKRPVLNLARAEELLRPDRTTVLPTNSRRAGMRRRASTRGDGSIEESPALDTHQRVEEAGAGTVRLVLVCGRRSRRSPIVQRLASVVGEDSDGSAVPSGRSMLWLVVCDASTTRKDLAEFEGSLPRRSADGGSELELIWLG